MSTVYSSITLYYYTLLHCTEYSVLRILRVRVGMFVLACDSIIDRAIVFIHFPSVSHLVGLDSSSVPSFSSGYTV